MGRSGEYRSGDTNVPSRMDEPRLGVGGLRENVVWEPPIVLDRFGGTQVVCVISE
jgi:hypothetical protein